MDKVIRHNEQNKEMAVINLPISLLTRCKDKKFLRLVSIAVFIKTHLGDSNFKNVSIKNIKSFFGVGQSVATTIRHYLISNESLFRYKDYNNSVVANSFKGEISDDLNRKGQLMLRCFVVALNVRKEWKLKDVEKHIRKAILLNAINGKERSNADKSDLENHNSLFGNAETLTMKKMANIIGKSKSTARRELKQLSNEEVISIKRGSLEYVAPSASDESLRYNGLSNRKSLIVNPFDGSVYACMANEYHITNRDITKHFKHIIYNSSRRHTDNVAYIERLFTYKEFLNSYFDRQEQGKIC